MEFTFSFKHFFRFTSSTQHICCKAGCKNTYGAFQYYTHGNAKKIAEVAGVNISTVSKALNRSMDISAETKEKVLRVAQELGYTERIYRKRNLDVIKNRSAIGVIYPDIQSNYYSRLLVSIDEKIRQKGGTVITGCSRFDLQEELHLLERFNNSRDIAGILLIAAGNETGLYKDMHLSIPVVVVSQQEINLDNIDIVRVDDRGGINAAVDYLCRMGHRNIGFVGERFTKARLAYFRESMVKNNLPINEDHVIVSSSRFEEAGFNAMKQIMAAGSIPTAIFAAYDDIAIGVIKAAYDAGLKIPQDLSVIGEDDILISSYLKDNLTTISCHIEDQGEIASSILYKKINDPLIKVIQHVEVKTELIVRQTVASPRRD